MTKDEALKLALEALVLNNDEWKSLADSGDSGYWKAEDQDHYKQTNEAITAIKEALAQPEQEPVTVIRLGQCANQDCDGGPLQQGCWAHDCSWSLLRSEQKPVGWKLVPIEPTNEMLKAMDECSTEGYDERLYAGHAASVYMAAVDVAPTPPQRKEPEPVVWMYQDKSTHEVRFQKHMRGFVDHGATYETPLYTTPPQRTWAGLTEAQCGVLWKTNMAPFEYYQAIEAKLKEKNT